jgi:hypothetical protein
MELSDTTENPLATPGIDPWTFRLVAQCLKHYAILQITRARRSGNGPGMGPTVTHVFVSLGRTITLSDQLMSLCNR